MALFVYKVLELCYCFAQWRKAASSEVTQSSCPAKLPCTKAQHIDAATERCQEYGTAFVVLFLLLQVDLVLIVSFIRNKELERKSKLVY